MIKDTFLSSQAAEAKQLKQTPSLLRQLIFRAVDEVARAHYGPEYPMKCVQCSVAISQLLRLAGIESTLWVGALCAAEVFEEEGLVGWGGFWGNDHHVWVVTEFAEYVDLSISQLHHHPRCNRRDGIPIPPVWWSDIKHWPCVLKYLRDSPAGLDFNETDQTDLTTFTMKVGAAFDALVNAASTNTIHFGAILHGPEHMNTLYEEGNSWVTRAIVVQTLSIPFPRWIQERELELINAFQDGTKAASRLSSNI